MINIMSQNKISKMPSSNGFLGLPFESQFLQNIEMNTAEMLEQSKKYGQKQGNTMIVKQLPSNQIGNFAISSMLQRMQYCQIEKERQRQEFVKKSQLSEKIIKDYYKKSKNLQKQLEELKKQSSQKMLTLQQRLGTIQKNSPPFPSQQIKGIIERQKKNYKNQRQCETKIFNLLKLQSTVLQNSAQNDCTQLFQIEEYKQLNSQQNILIYLSEFLEKSSKVRTAINQKLLQKIMQISQRNQANKQKANKQQKQLRKSLKTKEKQIKRISDQLNSINTKMQELQQLNNSLVENHRQQVQAERKTMHSIMDTFKQSNLIDANLKQISQKALQIKSLLHSKNFQRQFENIFEVMAKQYISRRNEAKSHAQTVRKLIEQTKRHFSSTLDSLFSKQIGLKIKISSEQQQLADVCKICYNKPLEMINQTCNHVISCFECSQLLNNQCCLCKKKGQYKKIYKM